MKKKTTTLKRCSFQEGLQSCGLLIVPLTVKDKTRYFLIDTGSQRNAVSDSDTETMAAFKQTNQIIQTQGLDGHVCNTPLGRLNYSISGCSFEAECFVISGKTFASIKEDLGYEISGLLGVEFLRRHNCIIDFTNSTVIVDVSENEKSEVTTPTDETDEKAA